MDGSSIVLILLVILILLLAVVSLFLSFHAIGNNSTSSNNIINVPNVNLSTDSTSVNNTINIPLSSQIYPSSSSVPSATSSSNNFLVHCPQALEQIVRYQALGASVAQTPQIAQAHPKVRTPQIAQAHPKVRTPQIAQAHPKVQIVHPKVHKNVKNPVTIHKCNMINGVDQSPANIITTQVTPQQYKQTIAQRRKIAQQIISGDNSAITNQMLDKETIPTIGDYKINDQLYSELLRNEKLQLKHQGNYLDVCDIQNYQIYINEKSIILRKGQHIIHEQNNNKLAIQRIWFFAQNLWALDKNGKILKLLSDFKQSNWRWSIKHQFTDTYRIISCTYNNQYLYVQSISDNSKSLYFYTIYRCNYKDIVVVKQGYSNDTLIYGKDEHSYIILQEDIASCKIYINSLLSYQVDDVYKAILDYNDELVIVNKKYEHKYRDIRILHQNIYYLVY